MLAVGRPSLQLTDPRTVESAIAAARPQVVVSAAAYTDIEGAELNPSHAEAVNVQGAEAVAVCTRKLGIPLIHLSTAYVFDETSAAPYRESDTVNPLSAYGRSKEKGERAVSAAQAAHVVLRTSLANSPFERNFAESILLRASRQNEIPVVTDQLISPTAASDLAEGILAVARNLLQGEAGDRGFGTFHMASVGAVTPMKLALAVLRRSAQLGGPTASLVPIKLAEYVLRVRPPPNVTLDCSKLAAIYGIRLPEWRASIDACVGRLIERLK